MYYDLVCPEYAPLPTSFVLAILGINEATFREKVRILDRNFMSQLRNFEAQLDIERRRIYALMAQVKENEELTMKWFRTQVVVEIQRAAKLTVRANHFMGETFDGYLQGPEGRAESDQKEMDAMVDTIENGEISRQTISRWKVKGLLPQGIQDSDRLAAILISLAFGVPMRGKLPSSPSYYCYKLPSPSATWEPCPVPLPNDLSPATLLWTPHQTLQKNWLVTAAGSLRWGKLDVQNRWLISGHDLGKWNPILASPNAGLLDLPGMGREARHDIANATLKLFSMSNEGRPFTFPVSTIYGRSEKEEDNESTNR